MSGQGKHHIVHHEGEGEPEFRFKVLGHHKSALTRQISEAVQIMGRENSALYSKGEYDRCKIHRLTIENPEDLTCWKENTGGNNEDGRLGEQKLLENRIEMDRRGTNKTGTGLEITRNQKRGAYVIWEETRRKSKKRKYVMAGED